MGPSWDLRYARRAAAIALAVTAVGVAWSTAAARDTTPRSSGAGAAMLSRTAPAQDPGQNARYWIGRINAPRNGSEPARAFWITPQN